MPQRILGSWRPGDPRDLQFDLEGPIDWILQCCPTCAGQVTIRRYPQLPATFLDCLACMATWELLCSPCESCDGTGWVEDKNWHPEFVGETRRNGSGFLVCGSCGA